MRLSEAGAEVVAAPTPYTAFDYLHERAFDAAVLWGGQDHAPALSIASGMKRNTRLYHIPLTLYLRGVGQRRTGRPASAEASPTWPRRDTPEDETAERVLALARNHRRRQAIRRALDSARGSDLMDPATGLFTRDLFAAHLARVAEGAASARPIAVGLRSAGGREREPLGQARERRLAGSRHAADRRHGVATGAGRGHGGAPGAGAVRPGAARDGGTGRRGLAAERIAAVIACTAFDAGPNRSPFVVEFDVGVAEMDDDETPAAVLERASADVANA